MLKCFSSSLPPVISPVSCCHQLIASQGPCMSPTRSCLQISFCLHPERGPVPLRSLSGCWGPTCSPVSWVHLLGGPLTAVPGCLCFGCQTEGRAGSVSARHRPCGPLLSSDSHPAGWHQIPTITGPCCVLASRGPRRALLSLGTPERVFLSSV